MNLLSTLSKNFEEGKFQEIIKIHLDNEISTISQPSEAFVVAAAQFRLNNIEACSEICDELYPIFNGDTAFLGLYGAVKRKQGNYEVSRSAFYQALEMEPNNSGILNNLANLLVDTGEINEASQLVNKALRLNPYNRADLESTMSRIEVALKAEQERKVNNVGQESGFIDPIDAAFSFEEASEAGLVSLKDEKVDKHNNIDIDENIKNLLKSIDANAFNDISKELDNQDSILQAIDKIKFDKPTEAINIANAIHNASGPTPSLYLLVADIYITNKLFADAENTFLLALLLGDINEVQKSKALYNLINLTCMRGNASLAKHFFDTLKAMPNIFNSEKLSELEKLILQTSNKSVPFQFNIELACTGISRCS